jgi:DNA primase
VPLSRFLLDAASADCELDTAEGRARMASQARPLWSALPEGALKSQLLADIAHTAALDAQDLLRLWAPSGGRGPTGAPRSGRARQEPGEHDQAHEREPGYEHAGGYRQAGGYEARGTRRQRQASTQHAWQGRARSGRRGLMSREDRALGLLLSNTQSWDQLSADDHHLLAALPAPHGPLFAWLEAQLHEHGHQPWAALREALRGHEHEALACQQVEHCALTPGAEEDAEELGSVMNELRRERLERESEALAQQLKPDVASLHRLREIREQIEHLKRQRTV